MIEIFYRGYIPTKNKKALMGFKDVPASKLLNIDEAQKLPEYAGVMAHDAILVDIDDMDEANLLFNIIKDKHIKCEVLQSRSGMHFLFKNSQIDKCPNRTRLACGLTADIKSGFKNSYEVLKIDNKEREVLYDIPQDDEYEEIPKWLFPVKVNHDKYDFPKMDEGAGRNQALYSYILPMQGEGFTVDEIRECITIINQYILKESLSEDELEVILRDEAFQKPVFYKGNTFLFDRFALYLIKNNYIIRINGQLHIFKNGIYIPSQDEIEAAMIAHISGLSQAKRTEVWKYLNLVLLENTPSAPVNYIAFRNGIFDINTNELKPFSPDIVITNRIPWDYNPNAYSELADKTLNKIACFDSQVRTILEECIGSCFYRTNTLGGGKAFILTGEGSNGKSTFIEMIQHLLSEENISALDLKELDEKFMNASLFGKLANLGDDISDEFIVNASIFKKLVTGNRLQVQNKGEKPFEFNNFAKMIFSANNIPRIKDKTGAVLRRLLIVPFNGKFTKEDPDYDPQINVKLSEQEVMEYLITIGIKALKQVLEVKSFTESEKIQEQLKEYEEINNPLLGFLAECESENFNLENQPIPDVFAKYELYCSESGLQNISKPEFTKQVKRLTGLDKKQVRLPNKSNPVWIFIKAN